MIKGVIFDLGHTLMVLRGDLAVIERGGAEAMADWLITKKRTKLDAETLVETFLVERGRSARQAFETGQEVTAAQTLTRALHKIEAPATVQVYISEAIRCYFEPEEAACEAYPDAVATLKALSADRLRLGLLSNATDDALVQRLVNKLYLRPWLSPTFSSAGLTWRKPRPEPFWLIAERWDLAPAEIVVVGNTLDVDVLGAQNAGMKSILITQDEHPSNAHNRHIQPEATVERLAELPAVLTRL